MTTLLILSDSHGYDNLINKILKKEKYDFACFAGDYTTDLSYMKDHFDWFVDGNNDYGYKDIQAFKIEDIKFALIHSHQIFSFDKDTYFGKLRKFGKEHGADIVIYGHTHYEHIDDTSKPILINPGSISLPRRSKKGSYILATIDKSKIYFDIKYI